MKLSRTKKVLIICMAGLLLFFIGYQLYVRYYTPFKTEIVYDYTEKTVCKLKGVIIRNETVLKSGTNGIIHYLIDDGGRVAKEGVIADIYKTQQDAQNQIKINELNKKIEILKKSQEAGTNASVYTDLLNNEISEAYGKIVDSSIKGNTTNIPGLKENLLINLNKLSIATKRIENFNDMINTYTKQIEDLIKVSSTAPSQILADRAGYFVSKVDGYETLYNFNNISNITLSDINNIMASKPVEQSGEIIGKIIEGYDWYYAAVVSSDDIDEFSEGKKISLKFSSSYVDEIPAVVRRVSYDKGDAHGIVVFECNRMSKSLSVLRVQDAQTSFNEAKGLRVNKKAVRIENDVKGVYVKVGKAIYYRPIVVIYENDNYVICDTTDSKNRLKLYDEIIIDGKDLYNGKSIR